MRSLSNRKPSLAVLALVGCVLLPALPAEAGDSRQLSRLVPVSQDLGGIWQQLLFWLGLGGEKETPGSLDDQEWSHAAGREDAGPYIDPDGSPRLNGTSGKGGDGAAIYPISGR